MDSDWYHVNVKHCRNPHLVWVEVHYEGRKALFEQIGVYGVLPQTKSLKIGGGMEIIPCLNWTRAATLVMMDAFQEAEEVWFRPTFIDRRCSIFDDNIHKYGEFIIKTLEGEEIELMDRLLHSEFALLDESMFHQKLSSGQLNTKLDMVQTHEVIKQLEQPYLKRGVKNLKSPIEKQISLYRKACELERELTTRNIDMQHQVILGRTVENKKRDIESCKDDEDYSVGRAVTRLPRRNITKNDSVHALMATKMYLDESIMKSKSSTSSEMETTKEADIQENTEPLRTKLRQWRPQIKEETKQDKPIGSKASQQSEERPLAYGPPDINPSKLCTFVPKRQEKSTKSVKQITADKNVPYSTFDKEDSKMDLKLNIQELKDVIINNNDDGCVDYSNIGQQTSGISPISNTSNEANSRPTRMLKLLESFKSKQKLSPKSNLKKSESMPVSKTVSTGQQNDKRYEFNNNIIKISSPDTKSKSLYLQKKRMMVEKNRSANLSSSITSASDTSNKDTSSISDAKACKDGFLSDDDESVVNLMNQFSSTDSTPKFEKPSEISKSLEVRNHVNPFKNLDGSNSVFVDKLVSPILVVHTKHNHRIQPQSNLRDIPFNKTIHLILKNMSVSDPLRLQSVSWPTILRGHSVFLISPSKGGKTMGYLPAVCRLVSDNHSSRPGSGPTCIIVCATAQSVAEVKKISSMFLGIGEKVLACYSGMQEIDILTSLLNGCDLLICTPPILVRLLKTDMGVDLRRLSTLVLEDCERTVLVYRNECKIILYKVKEMLKSRANKTWRVQLVVASRVWLDLFESLAKKAPDTVICIGAFQECVLYSKAQTSMNFVKKENKVDHVLDFMKTVDISKKTVVVCRTDSDVEVLQKALKKVKCLVFACDNSMTVHDLFNLNVAWSEIDAHTLRPILLCCDGNLVHFNITNANYLVHYSMPDKFSTFCKRFAVLIDNYASIFKNDEDNVKIKVLLEEDNTEQLPKILNFVKRCTPDVPEKLNEISEQVLKQKDVTKAENYVKVCDTLLAYGECADFWNCIDRHTVFKDFDKPKDWMPRSGIITFKILHYHSAVTYSARVLSNIDNGKTNKFPQTYSTLSMKLGMYYSKESNLRLHGVPKVGDVCAVCVNPNFYTRCQVTSILSYQKEQPYQILINLIDEERTVVVRDIYLYYLPEELKAIETHVVKVRLANIQPTDNDILFSELALKHLKAKTDADDTLYLRGRVVLTIGNNIFVDTLEACQDLLSLKEIIVKYNFKQELLENHAKLHPEHIVTLKKLCNIDINDEDVENETYEENTPDINKENEGHHIVDSDEQSVSILQSEINKENEANKLNTSEPPQEIADSSYEEIISNDVQKDASVKQNKIETKKGKKMVQLISKHITVNDLHKNTSLKCNNSIETKDLEPQKITKENKAVESISEERIINDVQDKYNGTTDTEIKKKYVVNVLAESNCEEIILNDSPQNAPTIPNKIETTNVDTQISKTCKRHKKAKVTEQTTTELFSINLEEGTQPVKPNSDKNLIEAKNKLYKTHWATLDINETPIVYISAVENAGKLYLRSYPCDDFKKIDSDIEEYISSYDKLTPKEINIGDIVLAIYVRGNRYDRAMIEEINHDKETVECFYIDYGDIETVSLNEIFVLPEHLLHKYPFQAMQARLFGIKPVGDSWLDDSSDSIYMEWSYNIRLLFAKCLSIKEVEHRPVHDIILIDTSSFTDNVLNTLMIKNGYAKGLENEIEELEYYCKQYITCSNTGTEVTQNCTDVVPLETLKAAPPKGKLLRSVPLVDENIDDEEWDIECPEVFKQMLTPLKSNEPKNAKNIENNIHIDSGKKCRQEYIRSDETSEDSGNVAKPNEELVQNETHEENTSVLISEQISHKVETEDEFDNKLKTKIATDCDSDSDISITDKTDTEAIDSPSVRTPNYFCKKLPARSMKKKYAESLDYNENSKNIKQLNPKNDETELDSDDLTSPDITQVSESQLKSEKDAGGNKDNAMKTFPFNNLSRPKVTWVQNKLTVTLKIHLLDVKDYSLFIQERSIQFHCTYNGIEYGFNIALHGVIDTGSSTHENKVQYILVKLSKILKRNWRTLTNGVVAKWIKYDIEAIVTSSDEEEVSHDAQLAIQAIHNQENSDNDLDDDDELLMDDAYNN